MTKQLPLSQSKRSRSPLEHVEASADRMPGEDMEVPADRTPLEHLEVHACGTPEKQAEVSSDSDEHSPEPQFVTVPQDVAVNCGEAFTCSCKLDGAKPIGELKPKHNEGLKHSLTYLCIFDFLLFFNFSMICFELMATVDTL